MTTTQTPTEQLHPAEEKLEAMKALAKEFKAHEGRLAALVKRYRSGGDEKVIALASLSELAETVFPMFVSFAEAVSEACDELAELAFEGGAPEGSVLMAEDAELLFGVLSNHEAMLGGALKSAPPEQRGDVEKMLAECERAKALVVSITDADAVDGEEVDDDGDDEEDDDQD